MASARDIRRRIKSVKNTAQITKAMQLVAASKMKKAQEQALSSRAFAKLLNEVLVKLRDQTEPGPDTLGKRDLSPGRDDQRHGTGGRACRHRSLLVQNIRISAFPSCLGGRGSDEFDRLARAL